MNLVKRIICFFSISFLYNCPISAVNSDENRTAEVEVWCFEQFSEIERLLNLKKQKGDTCVLQYFRMEGKLIVHFMYDSNKYIVETKEINSDYILSYKGNELKIVRLNMTNPRHQDQFYIITDQKSADIVKRQKQGDVDGYYNKKPWNEEVYNNVDLLLKYLRETYEFSQKEEEAFRKDPPNMMKGGK